ncbi:MAG: elongation factor Ts [Rhodobacteraceae bacterium]|nr:MAG: elongation factor Ts [Paracoccaceae bacterium]|tara:strand:+ start:182 stop:1057 length:876 start_codon:yes stop_codon:yes gene_type:complete
MTVTAKMVKDLRDTTGAGMMDAKRALVETSGDFEAASDWLKQKGLAKAQKKSGRIAAEGLVGVKIDKNSASIIEANCETDFVAKNDEFQNMVTSILIASKNLDTLNKVLNTDIQGRKVEEILTEKVASIGEKISLRRYEKINSDFISSYVHNSVAENLGKIGVLVALSAKNDELGKQIAMHIAACNPLGLNEEDIPSSILEREKKVFLEQAKDSGKPPEIVENMVKGKLKKFVAEVTLLNQNFVLEPDNKILEVVKKNGVEILDYVRFEVGEGIDKPVEDFAEEVKKTALS